MITSIRLNESGFGFIEKNSFRFSEKVYSIYESVSAFGFGEYDVTIVCLHRITAFIAKSPFDLQSESWTGFTVNPQPV